MSGAVFISNLLEAISSTKGLAGYGLFQNSSPEIVGFVLAVAAGAINTVLADTMVPEALSTAAS